MSLEFWIFAVVTAVAVMVLGSLCCCVAIYLMHADVQHSIEDIKHFLIANLADSKNRDFFLPQTPPKVGDIRISIPNSLKSHLD